MKYVPWLFALAISQSNVSQLLELEPDGGVPAPSEPSEPSKPDAGTPSTDAVLHEKLDEIHDSVHALEDLLKQIREVAP